MDFFAAVLRALDVSMEQPQPYGVFHLLWLIGTLVFSVWFSLWHRKHPADRQRKVILTVSVIVILLELYKQINYSFSYENGISYDYQWYIFPLQFCSTPMYVGLLAGLTKQGKVHDAACAYLVSFALFAGVAVMLYPVSIYIDTVGINIQTSFCHCSMIFLGIYLMATGYVRPSFKTLGKAVPVFVCFVALAAILNEIAYQTGLLLTESFNMFYISPHCDPHLPVYSLVQEIVPFPWCLVLYVLGFTAAGGAIQLIAMGIRSLNRKTQKQTA